MASTRDWDTTIGRVLINLKSVLIKMEYSVFSVSAARRTMSVCIPACPSPAKRFDWFGSFFLFPLFLVLKFNIFMASHHHWLSFGEVSPVSLLAHRRPTTRVLHKELELVSLSSFFTPHLLKSCIHSFQIGRFFQRIDSFSKLKYWVFTLTWANHPRKGGFMPNDAKNLTNYEA